MLANRVLMIVLIVMVGVSVAFMNETVLNKSQRIFELERINKDLLEVNRTYSQSIETMIHMVEAYNKVLLERTYQPYTRREYGLYMANR